VPLGAPKMLLNLENTVDFDKATEWQRIRTNGETGVTAGLTKGFNHQVGCAIDHAGLAIEIIG
jgi:hypothetical protein